MFLSSSQLNLCLCESYKTGIKEFRSVQQIVIFHMPLFDATCGSESKHNEKYLYW